MLSTNFPVSNFTPEVNQVQMWNLEDHHLIYLTGTQIQCQDNLPKFENRITILLLDLKSLTVYTVDPCGPPLKLL